MLRSVYIPAVCALLLLITGCATQQPLVINDTVPEPEPLPFPVMNGVLFGDRPALIEVEQLFQLSAVQRSDFLAYFNDQSRQETAPHERTFEYLEPILGRFEYHDDTLQAHKAMLRRAGNCMSLAILTTALTDLAGVDMRYQLVEEMPVLDIQGGLLLSVEHVRTILRQNTYRTDRGSYTFGHSSLTVDFFPDVSRHAGRRISRDEFIAMYYRNQSAEALINGQLGLAYWNAIESLQYAPDHEQGVNLLAVIHRRAGDTETAEALYQYGLKSSERSLSLLDNYRKLLMLEGRSTDAQVIEQRLAEHDESDPLGWLSLAHAAHQAGQYAEAERYYRKVLRDADYLHKAWLALAQVQHALGHTISSQHSIKRALETVYDEDTRERYRAKQAAMARLRKS